jgi:PAS domain-containing protein
MNILKLPFNIENDKLSHTERFLHEVISTLQKNERPQETPTLRFFTAVRSHFADGCALVVNDDTGGSQNWTGDAQLTEWFGSEIALAKQEGRKGEPFVGYETTQGVSYLAMPMNTPQSEAVATYMVLWRVGRLFHSEDLVAIKLAMALYQGHYTFGHQAPNRENIALTAEASDSALREQRLKDALDAVPEIVTLCGEHGEVRWYNKAASECLAHTRVPVSEYKDISWLAHLVHVDDVHEVLPRIKIALDHTKSLQIFMRLPVVFRIERDINWLIDGL